MKHLFLIVLLAYLVSPLHGQIKIASGIEGEIYTQFANDINNNTLQNIDVLTTSGSLQNIDMLEDNSVQLAFVQYDVLLFKELDKPGIKDRINVFLPLYEEEIHLITKNNGQINELDDLVGKRVGVGDIKSGTFVTSQLIKLKTNLEWQDVDITFSSSLSALLKDSIDAFFFVGAAPSNKLKRLSSDLGQIIKLVPVFNKNLEDIYQTKKIDKKVYGWMSEDVKTYSVKSVLAVGVQSLSERDVLLLDSLYIDLKSNLLGIQRNTFSHPKWDQVNFSDMKAIDWPVFKQEYVTRDLIIDIMAILAALLSFIQIYFIVNKLWKRKHERAVAESISISAMFISILINGFFAVKNLGTGQIPQLSANIMWVASSVISTLIGVSYWVLGNKEKGFFRLLLAALNLERKEAGDLAKAIMRPSGASDIINILRQLALIDDDLDDREKEFIQSFADNWDIELDWGNIIVSESTSLIASPYDTIRCSLKDYLETAPPKEQVSQLGDLVNILVNIDQVVTEEEDLIQSEINGQIAKYLGKDDKIDVFKVAVVPQSEEQEALLNSQLKEHLSREHIAGGFAYLSESYYSERYAEIISKRYRSLNVFAVVFKPNQILNMEDIEKGKD